MSLGLKGLQTAPVVEVQGPAPGSWDGTLTFGTLVINPNQVRLPRGIRVVFPLTFGPDGRRLHLAVRIWIGRQSILLNRLPLNLTRQHFQIVSWLLGHWTTLHHGIVKHFVPFRLSTEGVIRSLDGTLLVPAFDDNRSFSSDVKVEALRSMH